MIEKTKIFHVLLMLATNKSFLRLSVFIRQLCNLQEATSDYYRDHIFKLNFAKNLVTMESAHFYNRPAFSIKKIQSTIELTLERVSNFVK